VNPSRNTLLGLSTSQGYPRTQLPADCGPWRLLAGAGWFSYGQGIVQYAKEVKADLVILGTRGRTSLRYVLLGSTAERLLRELHARC